jgi:hypothetical protein
MPILNRRSAHFAVDKPWKTLNRESAHFAADKPWTTFPTDPSPLPPRAHQPYDSVSGNANRDTDISLSGIDSILLATLLEPVSTDMAARGPFDGQGTVREARMEQGGPGGVEGLALCDAHDPFYSDTPPLKPETLALDGGV